MLDAEFAMIIYDAEADSYIASQRPDRHPPSLLRSRQSRHHSICKRTEKPHRSVRSHQAIPAGTLLQGRGVRMLLRHSRSRQASSQTTLKRYAGRYAKSSLPGSARGLLPTPRSDSCSQAVWIHRSYVPSPPEKAAHRYAPSR